MKLTTRNGEIDLPGDFSFNMERSNPLLLDEGDSSVPATLPSSSRNLAAIDHRERIDRAEAEWFELNEELEEELARQQANA